MDRRSVDPRHEPAFWFLIFHRRSTSEWVNRLVLGEFKHVSAFGFSAVAKCWVLYSFNFNRTVIELCPMGADDELTWLAGWADDKTTRVLKMPPTAEYPKRRFVPAWTCVQAVKRLVGLRSSGALRPDALWRDCLAQGAEILDHG